MKNIVIAAGYATRLGELTKNFPKPLLKIGQSTILGRMLDDIDKIPDIDEHIVITNHKFAPILRSGRRDCTTRNPSPSWMTGRKRTIRVWGLCATCCLQWRS